MPYRGGKETVLVQASVVSGLVAVTGPAIIGHASVLLDGFDAPPPSAMTCRRRRPGDNDVLVRVHA